MTVGDKIAVIEKTDWRSQGQTRIGVVGSLKMWQGDHTGQLPMSGGLVVSIHGATRMPLHAAGFDCAMDDIQKRIPSCPHRR
jgi:hypothetical protein